MTPFVALLGDCAQVIMSPATDRESLLRVAAQEQKAPGVISD